MEGFEQELQKTKVSENFSEYQPKKYWASFQHTLFSDDPTKNEEGNISSSQFVPLSFSRYAAHEVVEDDFFNITWVQGCDKNTRRFLLVSCKTPLFSCSELVETYLEKLYGFSRQYGSHIVFRIKLFTDFPVSCHDPKVAAELISTSILSLSNSCEKNISYLFDGKIPTWPHGSRTSHGFQDERRWELYIRFFESFQQYIGDIPIYFHVNSLFDSALKMVCPPELYNSGSLLAQKPYTRLWLEEEKEAFSGFHNRPPVEECMARASLFSLLQGVSFESALTSSISFYLSKEGIVDARMIEYIHASLILILRSYHAVRYLRECEEGKDAPWFVFFSLYEQLAMLQEEKEDEAYGKSQIVHDIRIMGSGFHTEMYRLLSLKCVRFRKFTS